MTYHKAPLTLNAISDLFYKRKRHEIYVSICWNLHFLLIIFNGRKENKINKAIFFSAHKLPKKEKPVPTNAQSKNQNNIYKEIKIKKSSKKTSPYSEPTSSAYWSTAATSSYDSGHHSHHNNCPTTDSSPSFSGGDCGGHHH